MRLWLPVRWYGESKHDIVVMVSTVRIIFGAYLHVSKSISQSGEGAFELLGWATWTTWTTWARLSSPGITSSWPVVRCPLPARPPRLLSKRGSYRHASFHHTGHPQKAISL